jgi:hypothetical protein
MVYIDDIKKNINDMVSSLHNPSIIDPNLQPNENIIFCLYSDGTVTRQKGGWAYGKRSITDIMYEIVKPNTFFTFPLKGEREGDTYAILTYDDCIKVRNKMNEFLLKL